MVSFINAIYRSAQISQLSNKHIVTIRQILPPIIHALLTNVQLLRHDTQNNDKQLKGTQNNKTQQYGNLHDEKCHIGTQHNETQQNASQQNEAPPNSSQH